MHSYAINNSTERATIPFFIALFCILLSLGIKQIPDLPTWLPIPTTFALYGVFYQLFDKFLWKWTFLYKVGLVKTPNLNGIYDATFQSTITVAPLYNGMLTIEQNWTTISLYFEGGRATSVSVMGNINLINSSVFKLEWEYRSEPKPQFRSTDSTHYGLTRLTYNDGVANPILTGDYFTEPSHNSYGSMHLVKR